MKQCESCGDHLHFHEVPPQSDLGLCRYCEGHFDGVHAERERIKEILDYHDAVYTKEWMRLGDGVIKESIPASELITPEKEVAK